MPIDLAAVVWNVGGDDMLRGPPTMPLTVLADQLGVDFKTVLRRRKQLGLPGGRRLPYPNVDRNARIVALYEAGGLSLRQIALRIGISRNAVAGVVTRHRREQAARPRGAHD